MERSCENWMSSLPEELWDVPLTHLAIPGTWELDPHVSPPNTHVFEYQKYTNDTKKKKKMELKTTQNL